MNATTAPHQAGDHPPDDLDSLLSAFFQGEVPTPWPPMKAPVATPALARRTGLRRSRLALAASVAALLAGGWLLGTRMHGPTGPAVPFGGGSATVPPELRAAPASPQPTPGRAP